MRSSYKSSKIQTFLYLHHGNYWKISKQQNHIKDVCFTSILRKVKSKPKNNKSIMKKLLYFLKYFH